MADDEARRSDADDTPDVPASVRTPWGEIQIPDDVSALADEAAEVRRALRVTRWQRRWRRLARRRDGRQGPGVIGPLLAVVLAMSVGVASLLGGFLPYAAEQASGGTRVRDAPSRLPDLTLTAADGRQVRLSQVHPSVILAVARCACADLVADTAAITRRNGIPLLVVDQPVARRLPLNVLAGDPDMVRSLADPQGRLPGRVAPGWAPRGNTALVALVAADGSLRQVLADVRSTDQYAAAVGRLT